MSSRDHDIPAGAEGDFKVDLDTWRISRLITDIQNRRLTMPRFQRGRRWDDVKQDRLIDSVFKGYPVSALIIHRHRDGQTLVDGLQRATTFLDYGKDPLERAPPDRILTDQQGPPLVAAIAESLGIQLNSPPDDQLVAAALDAVRTWARHTRGLDEDRFNTASLVDALRPIADTMQPRDANTAASATSHELLDDEWMRRAYALNRNAHVNTLVAEIRRQVDIGSEEIPVLIFEGRLGLLAEIFERMNDNVVPLTKYEIFAAAWSEHVVQIPSEHRVLKNILVSDINDSSKIRV